MTEKKGRADSRKSDRPEQVVAAELKEKRDAFLHTSFKRGAELTDELVHENRKLRETITQLEEDNASLKTQLASDRAIRDALRCACSPGPEGVKKSITSTLPVRLFFWSLGCIAVLFVLSWYLADAEAQALSLQGFGLFARL